MPNVFKGNINGTVDSNIYELPFKIVFFTVTNKSGGDATVNVSVKTGVESISIVPLDLKLSKGDMLQGNAEQLMLPNSNISITSTASVDYYFTIENVTAF